MYVLIFLTMSSFDKKEHYKCNKNSSFVMQKSQSKNTLKIIFQCNINNWFYWRLSTLCSISFPILLHLLLSPTNHEKAVGHLTNNKLTLLR